MRSLLLRKFALLVLVILTFSAIAQSSENGEVEVCFQVRSPSLTPPSGQQERPEKVGPPGPKGDKGETGECGCDPNELQRLNATIQKLQETVQNLSGRIPKNLRDPVYQSDVAEFCGVGMKDGRVPDGDITASSYHASSVPEHGRLDLNRTSWSAKELNENQWIQVDLRTPNQVTGVVTQGRYDSAQWVTSYKISYGNYTYAMEMILDENGRVPVFQGNRDKLTHHVNWFPQPITARYFRLLPVTWHSYICLRMEYLTCEP